MTIHRLSQLFLLFALACVLAVAGPSSADAQKKSKAKPPAHQQQPKKTDTEEAGSEEPAVQPPPQTAPASGGLVSWLKKYIDQKTNLGTLREVGRDYIVLEEDNTTTIVPIAMINSLKQIKEEDPPSVRLEIYLLKRD